MGTRRAFTLGLTCLVLAPAAYAAAPADPRLLLARRGAARVYILGFAEANDRSWLTPKIARAADDSAALWIEVGPLEPSPTPSPVIAARGYDQGGDLFKVLPAGLTERLLAIAPKIGVTRERLTPMRPWLARQAVQRAFAASKQGQGAAPPAPAMEYPDQVMIARFKARGAPIRAELPTLDAVLNHFADYPLQAQIEDLDNLVGYIEDERSGANADGMSWLTGKSSTRFIDKMRTQTPALYAASHIERNKWWAAKIDALLSEGGTTFVLLGNNHVLGPDSVPVNLTRRGIATRAV